MFKVKNTLILATLFCAWPVVGFAGPDPNIFNTAPLDTDPGFMSAMVRSILFIVVLGGAAIYLSKKFMPKLRPTMGQDINVRETVHLGPNKTVHIIEVGEKSFLVGSTPENISMLADVTETLGAGDGDEDII